MLALLPSTAMPLHSPGPALRFPRQLARERDANAYQKRKGKDGKKGKGGKGKGKGKAAAKPKPVISKAKGRSKDKGKKGKSGASGTSKAKVPSRQSTRDKAPVSYDDEKGPEGWEEWKDLKYDSD